MKGKASVGPTHIGESARLCWWLRIGYRYKTTLNKKHKQFMVLEGICQGKYEEQKYTMKNIRDKTQRKRQVSDQSRSEKEWDDANGYQ